MRRGALVLLSGSSIWKLGNLDLGEPVRGDLERKADVVHWNTTPHMRGRLDWSLAELWGWLVCGTIQSYAHYSVGETLTKSCNLGSVQRRDGSLSYYYYTVHTYQSAGVNK